MLVVQDWFFFLSTGIWWIFQFYIMWVIQQKSYDASAFLSQLWTLVHWMSFFFEMLSETKLALCWHFVFIFRHQRLYSLLDRFRLMVAPDTTSPSPLVTSHPLDGEDQPGLENVILDKVRFYLEMPWLKKYSPYYKIFDSSLFLLCS